MTQDTYLRTVAAVLRTDANIRIQASHTSKLNALGRQVERGECRPSDTVPALEAMFTPFVGRSLREALERALR